MRKFLIVAVFALWAASAFADGGRLRFRQQAGDFIVTLFTTPDPLTVGQADFSVAVEQANGGGVVQDADVSIMLTPASGGDAMLMLHATHGAATSRFLQAANFSMPNSGIWNVKVVVQRGTQTGECVTQVKVLPFSPLTDRIFWQIAVIPLFVLLFAFHRWRKRVFFGKRLRERHAVGG
ncbi:MAG: hypothetical protein KGN79_01515 [Acidobacteriota bacterium]|nr:hypothetical protein [Acidobacteriota bacterium]